MMHGLPLGASARIKLIARDRKITALGLRVACAIASQFDDDGIASLPQHDIAMLVGSSPGYVGGLIRSPARRGHIEITRGGGRGRCSVYRMVPPLFDREAGTSDVPPNSPAPVT